MKPTPAPPTVFLDTSVLKLAAESVVRAWMRPVTTKWGPYEFTTDVAHYVRLSTHERLPKNLRREVTHLPTIGQLGALARLKLLWHAEVSIELGRLPKTDDPRGRFYGAPLANAPDPIPYARIVYQAFDRTDLQLGFLASLRHSRFMELRRAMNAQPNSPRYRNQLLDAFHLWTAESAGADFFLTADFKLARMIEKANIPALRTVVATPSSLMHQLIASRRIGLRDLWRAMMKKRRERKAPLPHPYRDLVAWGEKLDKDGYFDRK